MKIETRGVYGQNVVNMILTVSGLGGARVNNNAIFCIFKLNKKSPPYPPTKSLNISQNLYLFCRRHFKLIFLNGNRWMSNKMSFKFVLYYLTNNKSMLILVMARCLTNDKPLSEPMLTKMSVDIWSHLAIHMMTSSNGNIFRVTGHLRGEFTGHRWIPHTKASDAEIWCL